jgi:hypothetical protein
MLTASPSFASCSAIRPAISCGVFNEEMSHAVRRAPMLVSWPRDPEAGMPNLDCMKRFRTTRRFESPRYQILALFFAWAAFGSQGVWSAVLNMGEDPCAESAATTVQASVSLVAPIDGHAAQHSGCSHCHQIGAGSCCPGIGGCHTPAGLAATTSTTLSPEISLDCVAFSVPPRIADLSFAPPLRPPSL